MNKKIIFIIVIIGLLFITINKNKNLENFGTTPTDPPHGQSFKLFYSQMKNSQIIPPNVETNVKWISEGPTTFNKKNFKLFKDDSTGFFMNTSSYPILISCTINITWQSSSSTPVIDCAKELLIYRNNEPTKMLAASRIIGPSNQITNQNVSFNYLIDSGEFFNVVVRHDNMTDLKLHNRLGSNIQIIQHPYLL
jgi:hypothetical protein